MTDACYQQLRSFKRALNQQPEAGPAALFTEQCESYRQRLEEAKAAASLLPEELAARIRTAALLDAWGKKLDEALDAEDAFDAVRPSSMPRCAAGRTP